MVVIIVGWDTLRNGLIIVLGGSWHDTSWAIEAVLSITNLVSAAHLILLQQEACVGPRQAEAGLGVGRVRGAGGAHHLHLLAIDGSHTSVKLLGMEENCEKKLLVRIICEKCHRS